MKKLLATTALVMVAMSGAASAQSVLERVLGSINVDNTNMLPVTGTFANIAENIAVLGSATTPVTYTINGTIGGVPAGTTLSENEYNALVTTLENEAKARVSTTTTNGVTTYTVPGVNGTFSTKEAAEAAAALTVNAMLNGTVGESATKIVVKGGGVSSGQSVILNNIDGSVTNVLSGVTTSTASVNGTVLAIDQVKVDIGNVSTTVLGAVNTGTTTLGVNSDYNKAIAGTSSAVSGKVMQLGGMADQTALVLNVASNATSVVGSVQNTFASLNGSVGNIATTVLGAVNTGTISSGVNAASNGIVAGIVGTTTP